MDSQLFLRICYEALYRDLHGEGITRSLENCWVVQEVTATEVHGQLKRMSKRRCADEAGVALELLFDCGMEINIELANMFTDVLKCSAQIPGY